MLGSFRHGLLFLGLRGTCYLVLATGLLINPALAATDPVDVAALQIGKPYVWGGNGPDEFDCSGLMQYSHAQVGIALPRTSAEQAQVGTLVTGTLERGDLLFFATDDSRPGVVTHVGIFEGGDMMINAMSPQYGIDRSDVSSGYWADRFLFARRVTDLIVVYMNNFETGAGSEWSPTTTSTTPAGGRQFLGEFGNGTVSLTLTGLPPHNQVTVSFDLFVIRSWDGNQVQDPRSSLIVGPDLWELTLADGGVLVSTTFSNIDSDPPLNYAQAYPDAYPGGAHPPRTEAVETNTLGYLFNYGGNRDAGDSVYRLQSTFNHSASSLGLDFSASGLQALSDESWGLDNVEVRVATVPTGVIQGTVVEDQSGAPVDNATVSAYDVTTFELIAQDRTDANGVYSLTLPPGTYVLDAFKQLTFSTFLAGFVATPIVVGAGQTVSQDITVVFIAPL